MLDGRIDTQGTVTDLRAQGVLEDITQDAAVEVHKEEVERVVPCVEEEGGDKKAREARKPRKLIKDEHRETGGVKWSIYMSYLKASYVFCLTGRVFQLRWQSRSYRIWMILGFLVLVAQLLSVTEKVWIMVRILCHVLRICERLIVYPNRHGAKPTNRTYLLLPCSTSGRPRPMNMRSRSRIIPTSCKAFLQCRRTIHSDLTCQMRLSTRSSISAFMP